MQEMVFGNPNILGLFWWDGSSSVRRQGLGVIAEATAVHRGPGSAGEKHQHQAPGVAGQGSRILSIQGHRIVFDKMEKDKRQRA